MLHLYANNTFKFVGHYQRAFLMNEAAAASPRTRRQRRARLRQQQLIGAITLFSLGGAPRPRERRNISETTLRNEAYLRRCGKYSSFYSVSPTLLRDLD